MTTTGAARYSQDSPGVPGGAESNDVFGSQVRLADFNRDGKADLAVAAPHEDQDSSAVWQLRGSGPGDYDVAPGSGIGTILLG
ncbi:FG-GAP repeat protein [Streptomyces echinoruber]|uniref:FG-GAP repeat protein n=1 Tax=Streptomyces echinoruber TaxID=68898 RepID=UPI003617CA46